MHVTDTRTYLIDDLATLEAINSPMRLRILSAMTEPATAREVAEWLGVPVTRLYYHINALERVGVIEVVEVRKSGARLQRVYRAVATHFQPGPGLVESDYDPERIAEAAAGAVLDGARLEAVAGLTEMLEATRQGQEEPVGDVGRCVTRLSPAGAVRFAEKVAELADEMKEFEERDGEEYAFSFVFFPMAGRGER